MGEKMLQERGLWLLLLPTSFPGDKESVSGLVPTPSETKDLRGDIEGTGGTSMTFSEGHDFFFFFEADCFLSFVGKQTCWSWSLFSMQ